MVHRGARWHRVAAAGGALTVAVALTVMPASAGPNKIPAGFDLFETDPESTSFSFTESFSIPPNFFAQGSEPFSGDVPFEGVPLWSFQGHPTGTADTIVRRRGPAEVPAPLPSDDTVPIELVALSLESVEPITVVTANGQTQPWSIHADVSPTRDSTGTMTITRNSRTGGTLRSQLKVFPLFTFTNLNDGTVRTLDIGALALSRADLKKLTLKATKVPWVRKCPRGIFVVGRLNDQFCAGSTRSGGRTFVKRAAAISHAIKPPRQTPIEVDNFVRSFAMVDAISQSGTTKLYLEGPSTIEVDLAAIGDLDDDGLEDVPTELVAMELKGVSSLGPITMRVRSPDKDPGAASTGVIEERANTQTGRLDLPPFAPEGSADSVFNVFFEIQSDLGLFHNRDAKVMRAVITHKPPALREAYSNPDVIQLYDEANQQAPIAIGNARHVPNSGILARFPNPRGAGLGIAFDGQALWITDRPEPQTPGAAKLFRMDTSGNVLEEVDPGNALHTALAFDRRVRDVANHRGLLWAAVVPHGMPQCSQLPVQGIDPATKAVVHEIDVAPAILSVKPCGSFEEGGLFLDGMGFDEATGNLLVSPDQDNTAYEINPTTGGLVRSFAQPSIADPPIQYYSGITVGANCIFHNSNDARLKAGSGNNMVVTNRAGTLIEHFPFGPGLRGEDLAFDGITFPRHPVVWVQSWNPSNNTAFDIVALEIEPCTGS